MANAPRQGWVLVWDIDGTIAGEYFNVRKNITKRPIINPSAVEALKTAVKARVEGRVDAILYLTNNSDEDFIETVKKEVDRQVFDGSSGTTFDTGLKAGDPERYVELGQSPNSARKSLEDVENMLKHLGKSTENLEQRVLFFDDMSDHTLSKEIVINNFIHITPVFTARNMGRNTRTRWNYVKKVLEGMPGNQMNTNQINLTKSLLTGGRRQTKRRGLTKKKYKAKI